METDCKPNSHFPVFIWVSSSYPFSLSLSLSRPKIPTEIIQYIAKIDDAKHDTRITISVQLLVLNVLDWAFEFVFVDHFKHSGVMLCVNAIDVSRICVVVV